ncbi:TetR family transcriptional regulator [Actinoplanes sp. SE50]|uniref:TetR/AcrR family transcriptional regulator n=1 Tax=unclassified Actinoplanes TaxID=2626549 RepID=UPI00023ECE99|nr:MULTISPECIES: TetR/AcrR family transcriptional regulator C-terminal domain-containing protein [unclassified Actinoplanes]AEV84353.1 Tetracycline repressor protein class H [Actinoplanes sp. SE50/110]ATO82745.1 TetR family transcriptional regulator [Actinoplanes sp. SE50]SLM00152.1 TetR family transcriptional regulator [Actinoplanes sp. SE50/110]
MTRDPDTPPTAGDPAIAAGHPVTGRSGLDQHRILSAAVQFIDENGLRRLTMQRLGAYLGVEAMALYRYVPGREALLDGVVETVVDELYGDPDVHLQAQGGWVDYLQRLAHGLRRIALAHPEVFPLVATRPAAAPWVRPPLRSLRWIESLLEVMTEAGFSDENAAAVYRAFSSFLLGYLLLEVSARGVETGPVEEPDVSPIEDLSEYPMVQRLQPHLSVDAAAEDFEEALEALLDRVALLLPRRRRPPRLTENM